MVQIYVVARIEQVIIKGFNFLYNFFRHYYIPFVLRHQNKRILQRPGIPFRPFARFVLEGCRWAEILHLKKEGSTINFSIIKPTRCTNFPNLLRHKTLHVSGSSSAHHQEFIHCRLSSSILVLLESCPQICMTYTSAD